VTHSFGSTGPLEWTAIGERLEGVRSKLVELADEVGTTGAAGIRAALDDDAYETEARRDVASTRLMELFRLHHSRTAFTCLYELNGAHLYQQVASRLRRYRCRADALDVLQEVFFNIYRYPHRFNAERDDAFRVWTATIVRNTVLKHMRSLSRSGRGEVALDELGEARDVSAAEPVRGAIENESHLECTRVYLNYLYLYLRFFRMLSEREQRAIQMVEVEGLSYRDAAGELGIKLENLKMVIFRARRKIHRSMRRVFEGLPADLRPAREPARRGLAAGFEAAEDDGGGRDAQEVGESGAIDHARDGGSRARTQQQEQVR